MIGDRKLTGLYSVTKNKKTNNNKNNNKKRHFMPFIYSFKCFHRISRLNKNTNTDRPAQTVLRFKQEFTQDKIKIQLMVMGSPTSSLLIGGVL